MNTFDDFLCFTLIYASHSDIEFSDQEKANIMGKFSKEIYDNAYSTFTNMNDYQALEHILNHKSAFIKTEEDKAILLENLKQQFTSDGDYNSMEKEIQFFLSKIL